MAGGDGPRSGIQATVVGPRPRVRAAAGLAPWLSSAAPRRARGEVTVALVSDAHMRRLNASFRNVDAVTDVLSFPAFAPEPSSARAELGPGASARQARGASARQAREAEFLGDIAIALGVARRQARAEGHALGTELRVLALHGLLHLLGYDHEADDGQMRRVEERLRRRAGLPAGLTARGGRRDAPARARRTRRAGGLKR